MLSVELVCAFLPQTELFVPFAAFFVAFCLVLCMFDSLRRPAFCILLGAAVGMASVVHTENGLERIRVRYAGRPLLLTAEVESVSESYYPGIVDAVLHVETANGAKASFRVECDALPQCEAGDRVQGRFVLSTPVQADRAGLYADGIAQQADLCETPGFAVLGQSSSFRARTRRMQKTLSASLRRRMDGKTGGVLAAMTVGDRSHLSSAMRSAYRGAGLAHVLVVSGMHVSILCGEVFRVDRRRKTERSYARLRLKAVWKMLLALVLVGVTGFTPSVRRAAVAVWVSALGVWVYGPPDTLTSLAVAGVAMTAGNSYAVCDVGFELSFAAVIGAFAGSQCYNRLRRAYAWRRRKRHRSTANVWQNKLAEMLWPVCDSVCVAICASAATFPVLVLRGLSVSVWAVVSSVAVLWLIQPMMLLGLGTAFTGLVPALAPLYGLLARAAAALTGLLNRWSVWLSAKPGAGIYFDGAYAVLVCLLLTALFWLAVCRRIRLRTTVPCIVIAAALAIGLGNTLDRDVVHIDLVGSANAPAVVVTQNDTAVVLFRGGSSTQNAVEKQLARRGVHHTELVVDLRIQPKTACTLEADKTVLAGQLAENTAQRRKSTPALVEITRTREGCLVRLTVGGRQFVTLSGKVEPAQPVAAQWLLASPTKPTAVRYQNVLALRRYDWMEGGAEPPASLTLRPDGTVKAGWAFAIRAGCGKLYEYLNNSAERGEPFGNGNKTPAAGRKRLSGVLFLFQ